MRCSGDDGECPNEAERGGLCWGHSKSRTRGKGVARKLAERGLSAWSRLTEAAIAYANADGDADYERAADKLRKSAPAYTRQHISELTREAMARLKAEGKHVGRPRLVDPETAARLVQELGGTKAAAIALGVTPRGLRKALRQARGTKGPLSSAVRGHTTGSRPPAGGG